MQIASFRIRSRPFLLLIIVLLVFALLIAALSFYPFLSKSSTKPDVFVGVDVGYGNSSDVYTIADAVSGYTNLIIVGSTAVTSNTTELTNVCNYLYQRGFYFIVYVGFSNMNASLPPQGPSPSFFQMAINRWGEKFLGAYMFDEAGGKQINILSSNSPTTVSTANSYSNAASRFITTHEPFLTLYKGAYYNIPQMKLFISDYALYWYDYLSGYDVVFTELLGGQSDQLSISLDRGAAESQGKDWGAILTFSPPPGIPPPESSLHVPSYNDTTQFYNSMIQAWQNNARYVVVFDAPGNFTHPASTPYGILTSEHLSTMRNFWNYIQNHERPKNDPAQTAYVLPKDYGYGFRDSNDTIWGIYPPDSLSSKIWDDANSLLTTYGTKLDVVYETLTDSIPISLPYKTLIFWNGTTIRK